VRNTKGVDDRLVSYLEDLKATARAKAMRFFGVDAEGSGKIGEGIAWIKGARRELGFAEEGGRSKGFSKFKNSWKEKREDRKVEKGDAEWGSDAGRFEEGRVLDMLKTKWDRMNDTVCSIQYSSCIHANADRLFRSMFRSFRLLILLCPICLPAENIISQKHTLLHASEKTFSHRCVRHPSQVTSKYTAKSLIVAMSLTPKLW
jgi:hypothetical protein